MWLDAAETQTIYTIFNDFAECINASIVQDLVAVSFTLIRQLHINPINVSLFTDKCNNRHVQFEGELFPAVSITYWENAHVNLFATGKVIILGKNAYLYKDDVHKWILDMLDSM